jgi:hypothetical protein
VASFSLSHSGVLSNWQSACVINNDSLFDPSLAAPTFLPGRCAVPASVEALVNPSSLLTFFMHIKDYFTPSQLMALLATINPSKLVAGQLSFILHTITGFHRLCLDHYYGFICHLTPTWLMSLKSTTGLFLAAGKST